MINNANDLAWVAYQTHEKGSEFAGENFKITHNIDFGNKTRWLPIGTQEHPFRGTIYGNGAVFKNLHVEDRNGADVSIFGNICDANVSDITIADTVRLTSVGREPVTYERKLRYVGHNIVSVSNLYDSEHGEYDGYVNVWVNNNVTIKASGNPKDNYKKIAAFTNDIEQQKDFFMYRICSCAVVENKDDANFLAMNSENELKHIKMDADGRDGGNVGIFGSVAGNSTISGINNWATLESFGGTVDYTSFSRPSQYGMYIKVIENSDGSKTVSYGHASEGYVSYKFRHFRQLLN